MTIDELQVLITANTDNLRNEIKKVQGDVQGLETKTNKSTSRMFGAVLKGNIATQLLSKSIQMISGSLDSAVSRVDILNNFTNVMSNLGVGSEDAEASINRLSDKLQGLPTTLDSAVSSVQQFTSANGNVKASTEMFLALNNAILAGGMSAQVQQSALEQLSQAYAKGKPDMMEWRSLQQAMPGQLKQVAQAMGYVSADQLGEQLRNGKVSMNDFMQTIVRLNHEGVNGFQSFEEQAFNSTGGIGTSIANMKTAITRGLAEIMNAIGRSNIASFFQGIARAINAVIPYITGFIKACVWAVSSVASLFGMKTKKNVDSVNKSVASLGSTAGTTTAGGLDKATGSAKKLKKELNGLASFDEMNILTENKNDDTGSGSGSGGGGTGGIGDMDLSGFDTALDNTKSKADEIAEYLKNAFKDFFEDVDFSILVNSFKNLGNAIKYFCSGAGLLLSGFIQNFLKPLATYTLNHALPEFLNATADAIRGINFEKLNSSFNELYKSLEPFTENIFNGLLWFYEKILIPLGQWAINDVLPAFLHILSGALDILNKAISDIQPIFEWLWDSILSPIAEWTGGVIVDVLNGIGDALKWIADNELAMTILEALAISIGLVAGAIAIYNGVMLVCNVVTGAFAGIMAVLTSPITLVVLAITAVIAVVILLIKHWDDVKNAASICWEWIKGVWNAVADWFDKNVISPIVDFFKGMWTGITETFASIKEWFQEKFDQAYQAITNAFSSVGQFFSNVWNNITKVFNNVKNWFKDKFDQAWTAIKNVFSPVGTFFGNMWKTIKEKFTDIGQKIGDVVSSTFKKAVNGLIGMAENVLNAPINAINTAIKLLNKVPGVNIGTLKTFSLPRMAKGGVVDKPTSAIIGEAGKEAVIPLERNTGWMDNLAEKINSRNNDTPQRIIVNVGDETLVDKVIDGTNKKLFETNGEVTINL